LTLNGALDPNVGYSRVINDTLTTIQPYAQYEWKLSDALTVTPGLKYSSFTRSFDAPIMQGWGGLPYNGSSTFSKVLPSLDAHYMIQPNWSAYAQYAQGFEAPIMQAFQKPNVDTSTIMPTETDNYQVGTTWKDERLTVSGDVYEIVSKNWMQGIGTQNGVYVYGDAGNVNFNGAEAEVTYNVGSGFSLYGNYAVINYNITNPTAFANAKVGGNSYQNGTALNNVPNNTMTGGVIYNQGPVYASLMAKETGARTSGVAADGVTPLYFDSYTITNFNASYTLNELGSWGKKAKIGFQVNNLFNVQGLYASNGNDVVTNDPLYFVIPTRSYQLSLSISM
jgi:iron complex outermembrane receptor protein